MNSPRPWIQERTASPGADRIRLVEAARFVELLVSRRRLERAGDSRTGVMALREAKSGSLFVVQAGDLRRVMS